MNTQVQKITLMEQEDQSAEPLPLTAYTELLHDLEVLCHIRVGTVHLTIEALKQLKREQVLCLDQKTDEPIDLLLNNKVIARGALMHYKDHFALQITELADAQ